MKQVDDIWEDKIELNEMDAYVYLVISHIIPNREDLLLARTYM